MRVIAGSVRGHKLKAPEGRETRPTAERIKESLFNIIAPDLYDCCFLDLFSGSGSIGIEALSRGAKRAVFVDSSLQAAQIIEENIEHTKMEEKSRLLKIDVFKALDLLAENGELFDIIFIDPPYKSGLYKDVLQKIVLSGLLADNGYIISEHSSKDEIPSVNGLKSFRIKDYKTTRMSFWTKERNK
ncbi:MAG: 16S rRNA (guanine(966)-N(2))-methyltransferase RsmD [Clostridia bacterium]|jgi:16S rRNA (guanine(966)-N(2))-methyltransferase RsmD|nr:16S rRNA (guanine(966)-N(2))-methyltransferase RsmD [Clostridia bacterium]